LGELHGERDLGVADGDELLQTAGLLQIMLAVVVTSPGTTTFTVALAGLVVFLLVAVTVTSRHKPTTLSPWPFFFFSKRISK